MVPEAPDDIVVVGDGALIAALTRSRGRQMRDIVATIQRHQDEAIRAPSRGVTEITGGPGTGKTVVALHRAAYLLYSERRRFENGGILVVGPSAAYTAYIERVLPSLGEESVALRALGDLVDGLTATRLDTARGGRDQGVAAHPARCCRASPPRRPWARRAPSGPSSPGHAVRLDEHVAAAGALRGAARAPAQPRHRRRARRPGRGRLALGAPGRARRVPRRLRRLPRRRRVPRLVVAPGRPARAAARRSPTPTTSTPSPAGCSTTRRGPPSRTPTARRSSSAPGRSPTRPSSTTSRPARPRAGGRARGRRVLRHRGARRPLRLRRPRRPGRGRPPGGRRPVRSASSPPPTPASGS